MFPGELPATIMNAQHVASSDFIRLTLLAFPMSMDWRDYFIYKGGDDQGLSKHNITGILNANGLERDFIYKCGDEQGPSNHEVIATKNLKYVLELGARNNMKLYRTIVHQEFIV